MSRRARPIVVATLTVGLTMTALTACAPDPAPTPTTTVTVTATVTATPSAPSSPTPTPQTTPTSAPAAKPSPSDPITPLVAWSICSGIATEYFPVSDWKANAYSVTAVKKQSDGTFRVTVGYDPKGKGTGAAIDCSIGGTVGAPHVLVNGPYDFG